MILLPKVSSFSPAVRHLSPLLKRVQITKKHDILASLTTKRTIANFKSVQEEIDNANKRFDSILSVRDTDEIGWGVYVTRSQAFKAGETVLSSVALSETNIRDAHTVQVDEGRHVNMDLPARFINHSCDPNLGIRDNENGAYDFIAKREIKQEEELFWDYESTEWEISAFKDCLCGAENCRKILGGFKLNGDKVQQLHGEQIANHLKEVLKMNDDDDDDENIVV